MKPVKLINEHSDMETFRVSPAKKRITQVIGMLSQLVVGCEVPSPDYRPDNKVIQEICEKLSKCSTLVDEIHPVQTPQRFGNPSYREWLKACCEDVFKSDNEELNHYLANSFGSSQRIDYGTGHELNFIVYFDGLILSGEKQHLTGTDVLLVFSSYFELCRKIIRTYSLEPAGSHGVWGLDDHFHLPYIFGAAQLSQLSPNDTPKPKDVLNARVVSEFKSFNLYFGAISFINEVKSGAFFEHSPILFDISGVKSWSKIKGGMIKMYEGEVLSKFPVVQHLYFGTLLRLRD